MAVCEDCGATLAFASDIICDACHEDEMAGLRSEEAEYTDEEEEGPSPDHDDFGDFERGY